VSTPRLHPLLLAAFPSRFKDRYGTGIRICSATAAGVAAIFVAWTLTAVAEAVFARAVNDNPVPGLRSWGWIGYRVRAVAFELTVAVILMLGLGFGLRVVIQAQP
jgi:hypothetical protein